MTDEYTPSGGTTPTEDEARAEAQKALDWFDSISGDRENGRVLIEYHVLRTLASRASNPPGEAWEYRLVHDYPDGSRFESEAGAREAVEAWADEEGDRIERRRPASPWEPVPAEGEA
jgi:hypothetical protein